MSRSAVSKWVKSDHFLISAVVPAFNRAKFVVAALESIRCQTYRPLEIIVVDDGSTDTTVEIVQAWKDEYEEEGSLHVRLISQENRGANAARNSGIQEAAGEYIAFLDSDDRWLPEKLVKQIARFATDDTIGGVYCGLVNVDIDTGHREEVSPKRYPEGNLLREMLIRDVTEPTSCWLVKKECFVEAGLFDTTLPARQDWDMWIRLAEKYRIGCVPEVLVEMGNHSGERVRSKAEREIAAHQVIFRKYKYLRERYPFWVSLAARAAMYRRRGRVYFHRRVSKPRALAMYLLAIAVWPFCFDSYAALGGLMLPRKLRQRVHGWWNRVFGKTPLAIKTH